MIKNNLNQNFKPYLGNYKPLNIYKGNTKIAGYTNKEIEGSSLHLENCYNQPFNGEIYGNSSQYSGMSKNLFDKNSVRAGYYLPDNGVVTPEGSSEISDFIKVNANETYTVSGITNASVNAKRVHLYDNSKNWVAQIYRTQHYNGVYSFSVTPTIDGYIRLSHYMSDTEVQIEKGSTATSYEQYGAMPSPGFPSEIENVTSIQIVKRGLNEFNTTDKNMTYSGLNIRVQNNIVQLIGNCIGNTGKRVIADNLNLSADNYTIELYGEFIGAFEFYDENNTFLNWVSASTGKKVIRFTNTSIKKIMYYTSVTGEYNYEIKIQIHKGTVEREYQPHRETLNLTLTPQQPMCSIGDVKDCFIRIDGVWKERHRNKLITLNGTENFILGVDSRANGFSRIICSKSDMKSGTNNVLTCNYYKWLPTINTELATRHCECVSSGGGTNYKIMFVLDETKSYNTLSGFKTWLSDLYSSGNPLQILYQLETPVDLICNAEQVAVLEQLAYYPQDCVIEFEGTTAKVVYAEMDI